MKKVDHPVISIMYHIQSIAPVYYVLCIVYHDNTDNGWSLIISTGRSKVECLNRCQTGRSKVGCLNSCQSVFYKSDVQSLSD